MGKVSLQMKAGIIFIISIAYATVAGYWIFYFQYNSIKPSFLRDFLFSLALALASTLLIILNDRIISIYAKKISYLYLMIGTLLYWLFAIHTGYMLFLTPILFFLVALGANHFLFSEDRKTVPHILTFFTVLSMFFLMIGFYSDIKNLLPYKFKWGNQDFLFISFMLSYFGVYHFFHVLFNLKNIAARMHCKK